MRRALLGALLATGVMTGVSLAQTPRPASPAAAQPAAANQQGNQNEPAPMRQAIQSHFPNAQSQIQGQREEDGVRVYQVRITPQNGQPVDATVTEYGDFLDSGSDLGTNVQSLPPGVRELTQSIWKNPPANVRQMMGTYYWVTVGAPGTRAAGLAQAAGSNVYALRFDGAGRLLDIKAPSQLHAENWQAFQNAPADVSQKLTQMAQARYRNAKVQAVKQIPGQSGFYEVRFQINGQDGWLRADPNGVISDEATTIAVNLLPKPVQQTINSTFNGDRVIWAARDDIHFYQVQENVGNQEVAIRVQPDGDVLSVHQGRMPQQGAIPAGQRQRGRSQ